MGIEENGLALFPTEPVKVPVASITTAPENDLIYSPFALDNKDDIDLALSIKENGIQEPLALSSDLVLLSGHRRLAAATALGLERVPCRVLPVAYSQMSKTERVTMLRLMNQQRDKTPGERIKEELLTIDPDEAYRTMKRKQVEDKQRRGWAAGGAEVQMGAHRGRAAITTRQFLAKAQQVIEENRPYWPLTVRRVHYLLLNDPPLKHDSKPSSAYVNDKASYNTLTNLLSRARLCGAVEWGSLEDSTRPIQQGGGYANAEEFIQIETANFLAGYSRDLMQGQSKHFEIVLEKNALRSVIESVAREYCITCTTGRGYSSLSPRYDLARRYQHAGKEELVLFFLTDFDPDGEQIAASFAASMRDDFGIETIHPVKVALTAEDVKNNDLPSDMDAKESSPNYQKFLQRYGTKAVELDAAPVALLQGQLRAAIEGWIDIEAFNAQIELERADSAIIEAHRRAAIHAIKGSGA